VGNEDGNINPVQQKEKATLDAKRKHPSDGDGEPKLVLGFELKKKNEKLSGPKWESQKPPNHERGGRKKGRQTRPLLTCTKFFWPQRKGRKNSKGNEKTRRLRV